MTQQEYSDLVAGHLSPQDLQRLTAEYGSETIAAILRGEKQLHDVLSEIAVKREAVDDLDITWDPADVDRRTPWLSRYAGWLVVLGILVVIASVVAIVPRMSGLDADVDFTLTDPLPLTIVVVLIIGLIAMIALERNDAG